jgi:hypothetical protein
MDVVPTTEVRSRMVVKDSRQEPLSRSTDSRTRFELSTSWMQAVENRQPIGMVSAWMIFYLSAATESGHMKKPFWKLSREWQQAKCAEITKFRRKYFYVPVRKWIKLHDEEYRGFTLRLVLQVADIKMAQTSSDIERINIHLVWKPHANRKLRNQDVDGKTKLCCIVEKCVTKRIVNRVGSGLSPWGNFDKRSGEMCSVRARYSFTFRKVLTVLWGFSHAWGQFILQCVSQPVSSRSCSNF